MNTEQENAAEGGFSRKINIDKIKSLGQREKFSASEQQCKVLAEELKINDLSDFNIKLTLRPWKKGGVRLTGEISAIVEEICVVTLEPFRTEVSEEVDRFFERIRKDTADLPLLDLESIDDDVPDVIEDGMIDVCDVAVETLAMSLSTYPRKPDVVFKDHLESNPDNEDEDEKQNPFSVLEQLKKH